MIFEYKKNVQKLLPSRLYSIWIEKMKNSFMKPVMIRMVVWKSYAYWRYVYIIIVDENSIEIKRKYEIGIDMEIKTKNYCLKGS